MILTDNLYMLKTKFPEVHKLLEGCIENHLVKYLDTPSGSPTLCIEDSGGLHYIHSKYNPVNEADKFIEQYQSIGYDHVLFYGLGLGYHIEKFVEHHPAIPFTLYEPNIELFRCFLARHSLKKWPQLKHVYLEQNPGQCPIHTYDFVNKTNGQAFIISLPSYERVFKEKYRMFALNMQGHLQERQRIIQLRHAFEKKWIINSLDNLRFTIEAQNIFDKRPFFKEKPVVIVAAGPSLAEEIDHLRYIKDNKLAYLFTVGSAISALLHHGIMPDGACSYDPHFHNVDVFKKVIDEQRSDIPLIYGSTVGYGTLAPYPGPKLYAITSKDEMAHLLLRTSDGEMLETVEDAPSIAVVALQLFHDLGCNPIILVGQNLAYRGNEFYATGIAYPKLSEQELADALLVEDVRGNFISTNWPLNTMRLEMENYTSRYTDTTIINTTQGGAKIKGTRFMELKAVVLGFLKEMAVVTDWYKGSPSSLNTDYLQRKAKSLHEDYLNLQERFEETIEIFNLMDRCIKVKSAKKATKLIDQFDAVFEIIQKNEFFKTILKPMNLLHLELIVQHFDAIRLEPDVIVKTRKTLEKFGKLIYNCRQDIASISPFYLHMQHAIQEKIERVKASDTNLITN